ncbi:hypothetical protein [Segatella salivae]|uniref:hypothetical protein n=1 Tax=Segatella salivae TaxID=228604 RepID=UPI00248E31D7|nr:hypothetical protein [Segatella salivae]
MNQRHRCYAFDSLRLPNDSAGYPGLMHDLREPTPPVLRFLSVIRHGFWREITDFILRMNISTP